MSDGESCGSVRDMDSGVEQSRIASTGMKSNHKRLGYRGLRGAFVYDGVLIFSSK